MRYIRSLAPMAVILALTVILAACTQAAGPSQSPSATPEPIPTEEPAPSDSPSEEPSDSPSPSPSQPEVIEYELPMIGRVTDDGTAVLVAPTFAAQPHTGEDFTDGIPPEMVDVVLNADDLVVVTTGPLFAEGESWYEVASVDGDDLVFAFGWVPGRYIERDEDAELGFVLVDINGQGEGGSVTADVILGTPVGVRFAAVPMPDADECDIDVTLTNTDGSAANIVTDTIGDVIVGEVTPFEIPSLFQNEPGTVTLEVETDCSFAATMTMPQS